VSFAYQGVSTTVAVNVHVVTTTMAPVTLTVRYAGSNVHGAAGSIAPVTHTFTLSGALKYDIPDTLDAVSYGCAALWVGVEASTTPTAKGGAPTYADLIPPPC
jgi:hypothetical protein